MKKPKVGLVGFFGWGNFGDELFLLAHKTFLSDICEPAQLNDGTQKPFFSRPVADIVKEHDALVIGGGDLIVPWKMPRLYFKAEYLEKPVFIVGVGVPTWKSGEAAVIKSYRKFFRSPNVRLIIARDPESVAWIEDNLAPRVPVRFFPDLVCAMDLPSPKPDPAPTFGLVLRHRKGEEDDFSQVRALCDRAKSLGYAVKHIVLGTAAVGISDLAVANKFRLEDEELVHSENLLDLCRAIAGCHALASMKFHGTVVATMYGIPSIALSSTTKNRNFLKLIERPDLMSSYNAKDLAQRLPTSPVRIPSSTRDHLKAEATRGYEVLRQAIQALS